MPSSEPRQQLLQIFLDAVAAVNGRRVVVDALKTAPAVGPQALIAVGKAAVAMAEGAREQLAGQITRALIVTKHGHEGPLPWPVMTASHPLPDETSLAAGAAMLEFIDALPEAQDVLVLLSGGASSMVEALPEGISLAELRRLNHWFLSSGIDIVSGNEIRKQLSLIKGGRLAQLLWPRKVRCLLISDVPGDDPASVASGPLSPPRPFVLPDFAPPWLADVIAKVAPVNVPTRFDHVDIEIIASIQEAMRAAADAANRLGYDAEIHRDLLQGDVLRAGPALAQMLERSAARTVHIWGGETTVRLPVKPGRGGRNQSLALATAIAMAGRGDEYFLAGGTDGTDGPGEDAGAVVDGGSVSRGLLTGIDAANALQHADAGTFLEATGDLFTTGPTGTNVMDLAIGMKY
ncbi:MAG: DUF4147 domain-containing protein [Acidiferrobacterales bacterium]|jgi:hydroxypyruvate reductase|nr:DUF4147 domain-containing protein [Acidiferrobacterales bacterium]